MGRRARMKRFARDAHVEYHMSLFPPSSESNDEAQNVSLEEIRNTPLFSSTAADVIDIVIPNEVVLPQYGLLAKQLKTYDSDKPDQSPSLKDDTNPKGDRVFLNLNAPSSAFICGSQGSGKSYTLSCMLEMALMPSLLGELPNPLAGIVFHYDKFSGLSSGQICEAAYLSTSGIPVRVLVSPSNLRRMEKAYGNIPGPPGRAGKPVVKPLLLKEPQLSLERMMKLMAIGEGAMPLYMEVVCKIIRMMALENKGDSGFDYAAFKTRIASEAFNDNQSRGLSIRLDLLESFMDIENDSKSTKSMSAAKVGKGMKNQTQKSSVDNEDIWSFEPGSLTIVDLSCPYVDEDLACSLFNMCLALFLENSRHTGRIAALDEAHKFMTGTESASIFTETLLQVIRQQRHNGTRVIIATQEPTISPKLLDLSSMTIVHRFTSIKWLEALKSHFAGVSSSEDQSGRNATMVFKLISSLKEGEALLFCPSAMLDTENERGSDGIVREKVQKLGLRYVKMKIRQRLSADGGKSILARNEMQQSGGILPRGS